MSYERNSLIFLSVVAAAALFFALPAAAQDQYMCMGDVNRDGAINIQDVQATIAQALGELTPLPEDKDLPDLDENDAVDVLDVQNMINSVLGTGGLVQRIVGVINAPGNCQNMWIVGVSRDGQFIKAKVGSETGAFVLRLRTHTAWALMLCRSVQEEGGQWRLHVLATLRLRLGDGGEGQAIPLMNLGHRELNLGVLDIVQNRLMVRETIQWILAEMAGRIDAPDEDENGIPDFIEPLLERLRQGAPGVPPTIELGGLRDLIQPCVMAWIEAGVYPDLTDENENEIPDFVEPLLDCIRDALVPWLEDHGVTVPGPDFVDAILAHIRSALPEWLSGIGPNELVDDDQNGIPDFVEDHVGRVGTSGPMDSDGDGIPNFAEDKDGDGIPNCEDPDCSLPDDDDCDGVPNEYDWDHDNNGVPDYAE
ncbi:MAG TPA: dockerin type I domain-containing protein [Candidatus Bathyarchaeia archaeon]|nr:dockerin type I domain-containing protein [Candidatus Bathyarchaeia archaeon]